MRGRFLWLALVSVALLLVVAGAATAQTRGLTLRLKASEAPGAADAGEVRLYGSSHALVIGIDAYTGGWPRLKKAVEDARAVAKELRSKGFTVTLKTNLKSLELQQTLKQFFASKGADPEARLLLWFAGHGHTINGEGFLVPADAPAATEPTFLVSALPMRDFGSLVRLARSKHVLSVFDACFAGTIFEARAGIAPAAITRKTTKPVRQFITSGDAGQQVRDDGSFREYFLRALRGEEKADFNDDGYVTGEELGLFLNQRMAALTGAAQTPKAGKLHDVRYNQGDFVFALAAPPPPRTSTPTSPPTPTGMTAEMMFWQSMKDSTNAADLQDYLSRFPNGTFVGLAKRRLAALTPATPTGPSPDTIREAQRLLKNLGYDPGTADGRIGSNTRRAIESFQRSHDLTVDGTVTDALMANLKVARKQIAAVRPAPVPAPAPSPAKPAIGVFPERHKPGDVFKDCEICPEMVVVPAGSFMMGSPAGEKGREDDEGPVHRVTIPRPFAVGRFEVTQAEYQAVMGSNPSGFKGQRKPVERVSWNDAKEFARKLSARTGKKYRLLSEAEWAFMARAGSSTKYPWGNDIDPSRAMYRAGRTVPVGSYAPNAFGVHDTVGNVWEWTEDCWHGNYSGAPTDGRAWTSGGDCRRRVLRGGSWGSGSWVVRSASRLRLSIGFEL